MTIREGDILVCEDCDRTTLRKSAMQRFCSSCSSRRDVERKRKWAKEHPQKTPKEIKKKRYQERRARNKGIGTEASESNRVGLTWLTESNPEEEIRKTKRVQVPFSPKFSKNALWSFSSKGHVYQREDIKALRDDLIEKLGPASPDDWFEGKIWIDIFVMKPHANFDAINVIDFVCDAVKKAIGIDDRWFCIRRLDWAIVKEDPMIIIGVSQAVSEHHRVCSYCGHIKPLDSFHNNKGGLLGKGRECKDCLKAARERAKAVKND